MKLDRVTITGLDRTAKVNPFNEMAEISTRHPYVEWGILVAKNVQKHRFPDSRWIYEATNYTDSHVQFSLHICGKYVRDICKGEPSFLDRLDEYTMQRFKRVQLNFSCYLHLVDRERLLRAMLMPELKGRQFILQFSDPDFDLINFLRDGGADVVPFFDRSGGRGKTPDEWPGIADSYCGYAGGLNPTNLDSELKKIANAAGQSTVWIDTESGVRNEHDVFDFNKVYRFLEISRHWVDQESLKPFFSCLCGWSGRNIDERSPDDLKEATIEVFGMSRPAYGFCPNCDALFVEPGHTPYVRESQQEWGDEVVEMVDEVDEVDEVIEVVDEVDDEEWGF